MKSIEDDLLEDLLMSIRTSVGVTEGNVSNGVPVNERSGLLVGWRKDETLLLMVSLMVQILVMKKFEKVMPRVWLSASVLVKSRSEKWRSSFVTLHCCSESVQSLSRQWKYTRRDLLMSLCVTTSTTAVDMVTFTPCGLPLPLKPVTFPLCSDRLVGKPLRDRLWWTMSTSLERSDLVKLICDDVDHLIGNASTMMAGDAKSTECLRTVSNDAGTIFVMFRNVDVMTRVVDTLKARFACTNRWSEMQPASSIQRLIVTQLYQSPRCPEDCRHEFVMWRAGLVQLNQATMPDCR